MSSNFFSPAVVCRPALPSDAADVLEFTKFIWEGHDYIKYVWDDWLTDPKGILAVAQYGGHAVGLGKLTLLADGQWWLEGLRVDPKFQGLKIGSHIHEYLDNWWKQQGGAVRLMTSSERVQVHHLCERMGYDKLGEVKSYSAEAQAGDDAFKPVRVDEVRQALEFAAARLPAFNGLMDSGWRFSEPDATVLKQKAEGGKLWWWQTASENAGLLACWEDDDDGVKVLGVGFAVVSPELLKALLADAPRLAHRLGYARVLWLAPVKPWIEAALTGSGYSSEWDGSAYLYGKRS
jgi:GNAT superfamily N-acetyltransferase